MRTNLVRGMLSTFVLFLATATCLAQEEKPRNAALELLKISAPVFLSLATSFILFIGGCAVVALSRRPAVIAAYSMFLILPLLLGAIAVSKGLVAAFGVFEMVDDTAGIRSVEIYRLLSELGMMSVLTLSSIVPAFLVVSIGLFVRTIQAGRVLAATAVR